MTIRIGNNNVIYSTTLMLLNDMDAWVDFMDEEYGVTWKYHILFTNDSIDSTTRFSISSKQDHGEITFANFTTPTSNKNFSHVGNYKNGGRLLLGYYVDILGNSKRLFMQFVKEGVNK